MEKQEMKQKTDKNKPIIIRSLSKDMQKLMCEVGAVDIVHDVVFQETLRTQDAAGRMPKWQKEITLVIERPTKRDIHVQFNLAIWESFHGLYLKGTRCRAINNDKQPTRIT